MKNETINRVTEILYEAIKKLDPRHLYKNPVMFITYIGAILSSFSAIERFSLGHKVAFEGQISFWLWITILFANFAEAIAEGKAKAQTQALKKARKDVMARKIEGKKEIITPASLLKCNDVVICEAGDNIPGDGEVIEGIASVDESAITGESAPVIRESGGDRSAVTGGTRVISDRIVIRITQEQGKSFIDQMIQLIEGAKRQKTPNEIALNMVLAGLSIIFVMAISTLKLFADYSEKASGNDLSNIVTVPALVALLVCLIPTTIGSLLSAIGIAGMNRLLAKNVIAKSGRAVEAAGDVDVLLLDKTGTITYGNRMAAEFYPANNIPKEELVRFSLMSSMADDTPEGKSIIQLGLNMYGDKIHVDLPKDAQIVPFTAQTRMSGVNLPDVNIRKGAVDAIRSLVTKAKSQFPNELNSIVENISRKGGTPLAVTRNSEVLGIIYLKDTIKTGIKEKFQELRMMGIKTIMITGDNQLTAAAIAAEAGVDDFIAEATPVEKLECIKQEQIKGHLVAMTGDGTNDAPALAQADVGVAMNSGTQAAREAGNMVDLDSSPTKLIEIVSVGKQLLMTRGSLTTFSIANDIAKYFAIIPAMFGTLYAANLEVKGPLSALNIMQLTSAKSAILSAVIFNAIIIIGLIPLALRGVKHRAENADNLLRRNLLIYGLWGLICPFFGIKLIDVLVTFLHIV